MDALLYAVFLMVDTAGTGMEMAGPPSASGSHASFRAPSFHSVQHVTPPLRNEGRSDTSGSSGGKQIAKEGRLPDNALLPGKRPASYVIVPQGWEDKGISMRDGCWAKIYDEDGLHGDELTILGPIEIPDVGGSGVFGIEWKDRISTIKTGKRAELTVYDNPDLKDPLFTVKPGQEHNANNAIGPLGEIRALKISCSRR